MDLQQLWFVLVAVLFTGFFILEGFDFGVGMLMAPFGLVSAGGSVSLDEGEAKLEPPHKPGGSVSLDEGEAKLGPPQRPGGSVSLDEGEAKLEPPGRPRDPEAHRRAALNTIGPFWDGNEVWLITAGGAMFAAFPNWYATVFSTLYLPLLAILFGMIVRAVAIEWRGKVNDPRWRAWADAGIAAGSWLPAILWGVAFAVLVRGLPVDADHHVRLAFGDVINAYTLLGGLATGGLFLFYGAVFTGLKTAGAIRDDAHRFANLLALPVTALVAAFGVWTQLAHGTGWTWLVLGVALVAQLAAVALVWRRVSDGWAFTCSAIVVAAVVVLLFGALYPALLPSTLDPQWSLTIYNASSTPYTLKIMTWAAVIFAPLAIAYQGWTYWVFRQRISAEQIPQSIGLVRQPS